MERAKKMVLIPQEMVDRLGESKTRMTDPANRLDLEMQTILHSPGKTDREKWKLYRQVLHRYLFYAKEGRKPLELVMRTLGKPGKLATTLDDDRENPPAGPNTPGDTPVENPAIREIVGTVPQKYQRKAELLLGHLSSDGAVSWDRQGVVSVAGTPMRGTNIVDLINDVVRERKNMQAVGRTRFASILHQLNTPQEYIGNPFFAKGRHDTTMPRATVRSPPQHNASSLEILPEDEEDEGDEELGSNSFVSISTDGEEEEVAEEEGEEEEEEEDPVEQPPKKKTRAGQTGGGHWWTLKLR